MKTEYTDTQLKQALAKMLPSQMPRFVQDLLAQLRAQNAELVKDKERLDWLEKQTMYRLTHHNGHNWVLETPGNVRTVINAAIKQQEGK